MVFSRDFMISMKNENSGLNENPDVILDNDVEVDVADEADEEAISDDDGAVGIEVKVNTDEHLQIVE